ncbi:MAG: hypothetical protein HRU19_29890 [Pseudobacteriovorax sp.]|nr:hypothetical protein [Pseudobacteriovorax sp.]
MKVICIILFILSLNSGLKAEVLKVSIVDIDTRLLEPATVISTQESMVASLLYASLIDLDEESGYFVGGLAKRFYWEEDSLILKIREKVKSVKGDTIDSDQIMASIIRSFYLSQNIPGNIQKYLCPKVDFTILQKNQTCENIKKIDRNTLSLTFPFKSQAFIEFLSSPVFGVVPSIAYRNDFKIVDFHNSTGRYSFHSISKNSLVLKRNKNHWNNKTTGPDEIVFIRDFSDENGNWASEKQIVEGKIDLIPTALSFGRDVQRKFEKELKDPHFYESDATRVSTLIFTPKGMQIPKKERQIIANILHQKYQKFIDTLKNFDGGIVQVLLKGSYGSFGGPEFAKRRKILDSIPVIWPKGIKVRIALQDQYTINYYKEKIYNDMDEYIEYVKRDPSNYLDADLQDRDMPHLSFQSFNVDFREVFEGTSFLLKTHKFNKRDQEADQWLDTYIRELDSSVREKMLLDLHFDSVVINPSIIPLYTRVNIGVSANGWKMGGMNRMTGNTVLWKMYKEK